MIDISEDEKQERFCCIKLVVKTTYD